MFKDWLQLFEKGNFLSPQTPKPSKTDFPNNLRLWPKKFDLKSDLLPGAK